MEKQVIKVAEPDLIKIKEMQSKYSKSTFELGDLQVQKLILQQQFKSIQEREKNLITEFINIQTEERTLADELTKAYGNGRLDLETGNFIKD